MLPKNFFHRGMVFVLSFVLLATACGSPSPAPVSTEQPASQPVPTGEDVVQPTPDVSGSKVMQSDVQRDMSPDVSPAELQELT